MFIVNPLRASVYWLFQGYASFVDSFCSLCFVLVFVIPSSLFPVVLWLPGGRDWPLSSLVCGVVLCFVAFLCGVPGQVWCLLVSIPDLCLLHFFE